MKTSLKLKSTISMIVFLALLVICFLPVREFCNDGISPVGGGEEGMKCDKQSYAISPPLILVEFFGSTGFMFSLVLIPFYSYFIALIVDKIISRLKPRHNET
ncbi:MAG: hypothetical protein NTU57_02550 [Candidatus Aenigmarchaeota archaeon]|nr:hypothetical protein [Candidatus Aenigmarchaeota archaeon]